MPRNPRRSRHRLALALLLAGTSHAAADAPPSGLTQRPSIHCYPGGGPTGRPARLCESERIVTVEPAGAEGSVPSPRIARLHEYEVSAEGVAMPSPHPDQPAAADRWSGPSIGLSGGQIGQQGGASSATIGSTLAVDLRPDSSLPLLVGAEIGHQEALDRPSPWLGRSRTHAAVRLGWALGDRWVIRASLGLVWTHAAPARPSRQPGFQTGLGVSYALDEAWALTLDYRFSAKSAGRAAPSLGRDRDAHAVLGGVTYRLLGP